MTDELKDALQKVQGYKMAAEERDAQRISFAYGNAPREDKGTKEAVRRAYLSELAAA